MNIYTYIYAYKESPSYKVPQFYFIFDLIFIVSFHYHSAPLCAPPPAITTLLSMLVSPFAFARDTERASVVSIGLMMNSLLRAWFCVYDASSRKMMCLGRI